MTIEERAVNWANDYPATPDGVYVRSNVDAMMINSYIQGATDQKKIEIDKAVEWLEDHAIEYVDYGGWTDFSTMYQHFRIAMEK